MITLEFLSKIPIFEGLGESDLDILATLWHLRTAKKSEMLFRKGDSGSSMFLIEEGSVEISVYSKHEQKNICVSVIEQGGFFGELALLGGLPRTATATTMTSCRLFEMQRDDFLKFLSTHPGIAISMINEIGKRLQATNELVTSLASKNVNDEMDEQMDVGDKLADRVADFIGSWTFLVWYMIVVLAWCGVNTALFLANPFDPYPFVFLNLLLALVASVQAPLIMMSQNRAQIKDRLRAEMDYQVNVKSELILQELRASMNEIRENIGQTKKPE